MVDVLETEPLEALGDDTHATAVQGGVDYLDVLMALPRLRAEGQGQYVAHVGLVHLLAHQLDLAATLSSLELHLGRLGDLPDLLDDVLVHGRDYLGAIGPEDFVAVVLLRVVGGGDHDAGNGAHVPDGVAELRHGPDVVEQEHIQAVGAEDVGGYLGEQFGVVAAVVGVADPDVLALDLLQDVVGESLGGHSDSVLVHPVGSDSHDAPETSGTEFKILVESVLEPGGVVVPELYDFHLGLGVEVPLQPLLGRCFIIL